MAVNEATAKSPAQAKSFFSFSTFRQWNPRAFVAFYFGGYYALGWAYSLGLMAKIDRFAIPIIKEQVGMAGLGAAMPLFQSYSSWAVRIFAGACAALLYDQLEKLAFFLFSYLKRCFFPAPAVPPDKANVIMV